MKGITNFDHWAMTVNSKPWAFVATVAGQLKKITHYKIRFLNTLDFYSWRRAIA